MEAEAPVVVSDAITLTVYFWAGGLSNPFWLAQPLTLSAAPKYSDVNNAIANRRSDFRGRFRPASGRSRHRHAMAGRDPLFDGFPFSATWELLVYRMSATGVAGLPAGIVAGEKGCGTVWGEGEGEDRCSPGATVAVPDPGAEPLLTLMLAATVKIALISAAA